MIYTCRELEYQQHLLREALEQLALRGSSRSLEEDRVLYQRVVGELEAEYAEQLTLLKTTFPRMVCCDAFATGLCVHGKPCECGWTQAPWPWIIHRHGGRFCDCHMESRASWMKPARIRYWRYFSADGEDLGHHLFPNSGPQRGSE